MSPNVRELRCPQCMAPANWDGETKNVTCAYCKTTFMPEAPAPPPAVQPRPAGGGGAGLGCAIAAVAVIVLLAVAGIVLFVLMRRVSSDASHVVVTTPEVTMPGVEPTAKKDGGPTVLLSFGEAGNGAGQLSDPRAIGVDMDENIYVADYDTGRVQKFDAAGKFQWIVLLPLSTIVPGDKNVWALVPDAKGTLWVSRTGDLLQLALADGKLKGTVKGNLDDRWYYDLAIDPFGNMVTHHHRHTGDDDLLRLSPTGKIVSRVPKKRRGPLAFDGAGNVYSCDDGGMIEVLDPRNEIKARFSSGCGKSIAVDGKGHIFLSGRAIFILDAGGAHIATLALKSTARSMALSTKGNIFVVDNDGRVTKLAAPTLPR